MESVRADIWLWAARFFKTRTLAKEALVSGRVEIKGETIKPARAIRVGETLRIKRALEIFEVEVRGISDTRGPAPVAQLLYAESEASIIARAKATEERRATQATTIAPKSKPDKKARRQIKGLLDHFWPG
jgi:ribosome-associated heat shock protein Hsp15